MSKSEQSGQIPFELPPISQSRREDLVESGSNALAVSMIDAWPAWPGYLTVLAGPIGSGKSHLAKIWANRADAETVQAAQLHELNDDFMQSLSKGSNLLIEDILEDRIDETKLFHILNIIRESGAYCLITSRTWPKQWPLKLNDLQSRVQAAQLIELFEPDDLLLKQVMAKLFADRQLQVNASVIEYCVLRMERSLGSASRLVKLIDEIALAQKSTITKNTAAAALEKLNFA